jgi:hypothetical protein
MKEQKLVEGQLVQLNPETVENPMFAACIMVVTEPKPWGAQGYVQSLGENGLPGGQAYYRAKWEEMEVVGFVECLRA